MKMSEKDRLRYIEYRLMDYEEEYADLKGWSAEEDWWEDEDRLYEAECYAYDKIERELEEAETEE